MKKGFISLWSLFICMDLLLIFIGLSVLAYSSENPFVNRLFIPACILVLCTLLSFIYYFVTEFKRPPDFTNETYNIAVWGDISAIKSPLFKEQLDYFLKFFASNLPKMIINNFDARALELNVTSDKINEMLCNHNLEFRKRGVRLYAIGSTIVEKDCAYSMGMLILRWRGTLEGTRLYHMLGHLVKIFVLQRLPDTYHIESNWWNLLELTQNAAAVGWQEEQRLKTTAGETG